MRSDGIYGIASLTPPINHWEFEACTFMELGGESTGNPDASVGMLGIARGRSGCDWLLITRAICPLDD
jgi:hypothetical protein